MAVERGHQLDREGIRTDRVKWNLSTAALYEEAVKKQEGFIAAEGPLVCRTGQHTGRSPNDKFVVREPSSESHIAWGKVNKPIEQAQWDALHHDFLQSLTDKELYVLDCYAGADPAYRLPVRIITEYAWHNLFCRNLFIDDPAAAAAQAPEFTVIDAPSFKADPKRHGTNSECVIALNFAKKRVLIGGTSYAGEMKKSIFTVLNYILPLKNVLSMHCSANIGVGGDAALFFGLSGTGKTTLSSDPERTLIGDDEHGWSDRGVFNFEGGCYAKTIRLSAEAEPQIYSTTRRFGTVLENVVLLTADAFGVLPPIARLTPEAAMYHFLSGYTAKVAGTEKGVTEPKATFSTCFGAPFLPLAPGRYAEMLGERIAKHQAQAWLVNTGWTGGAHGTGTRMKIKFTRAMIHAALAGLLDGVQYEKDKLFNLDVPLTCPDVPADVLKPRNTWADKDAYD